MYVGVPPGSCTIKVNWYVSIPPVIEGLKARNSQSDLPLTISASLDILEATSRGMPTVKLR